MKVLVAYSSITGNTEKIGKTIAEAIPNSECVKLPYRQKAEDYDLVFCGFGVTKGFLTIIGSNSMNPQVQFLSLFSAPSEEIRTMKAG